MFICMLLYIRDRELTYLTQEIQNRKVNYFPYLVNVYTATIHVTIAILLLKTIRNIQPSKYLG